MNGLNPLLPIPIGDLAACSADIRASILPPEQHSSYPTLLSLDSPVLADQLLALSLKCVSVRLPLLISTPPGSSLAHKALQSGSLLTYSSFLATPPFPCVLPNMPFSEETCIFLPLCSCIHTLPCLGNILPLSDFFFSQGLTLVQNISISSAEIIAFFLELSSAWLVCTDV